jgi:tRNA (cytidine/uridine-2'-O-)-methyltransferase
VFNIVLYQPEIPPNTGNIIRLTSNIGSSLHLIEPLGFSLDAKQLRRAGLDYHEYSTLQVHKDWQSFLDTCRPRRLLAFSTKGHATHDNWRYEDGDFLLFGPESRGIPCKRRICESCGRFQRVRDCGNGRLVRHETELVFLEIN